jgi:DNA polymerase-3 subunit beta
MQKIILSGTELKAIALCASTKDVRYYLNGVYVEATPKETRLIATDGHRLAAYRRKSDNKLDAPMVDFIIPNEAFKQIKPSRKAHLDYLEIEIEDGRYTLVNYAQGLRIGFMPIDGRFPDYRRVIPEKGNGQSAQFNPELLAGFQEAGKMLLNSKHAIPYLEHNGNNTARVCIKGLPTFVGAVMPYDSDKIQSDPLPWPTLTGDESKALEDARAARAAKLAA